MHIMMKNLGRIMRIKLFNLPDAKDPYALGKLGERLVALLLTKQGFLLLGSNFRGVGYEVDLITQKDKLIVVFEIKTTLSGNMDYLYESIRPAQVRRLTKGAQIFCQQHQINYPISIYAGLVDLSGNEPKIEILEIL